MSFRGHRRRSGRAYHNHVREDSQEPEGEPVVTATARGNGEPLGATPLFPPVCNVVMDNSMTEMTTVSISAAAQAGGDSFDELEASRPVLACLS